MRVGVVGCGLIGKRRAADLTYTRRILDWEPSTTFKEGLQSTIEWYYATRDRQEIDRRLNELLMKR